MKWFLNFLSSSIGQKTLMSLTGLFLCSFLLVHMSGNFLLFAGDNGLAFNEYAKFMTTNPLVKFLSYGLYAMILLHAFKGIAIWMRNREAKGGAYKGAGKAPTSMSAASRNMFWLGLIVFAFIGLHMAQFWYKMKFGEVAPDTEGNKNLYGLVEEAFKESWIVALYILSLLALSLHLLHGFQSAFQSLGLTHKKYTPFIRFIGSAFSVLVPLGFATMPLYFLFYAS